MDFRDSPAEAEFRARLRAWLAGNNPGLPASSTDDEYWARQAEWHTALYDAGFFGLSWPARYGGHDLPTVFDVILDEELAAAGSPPRPSRPPAGENARPGTRIKSMLSGETTFATSCNGSRNCQARSTRRIRCHRVSSR